jgi:Na+/melibiose symporter-like transporter
MAGVTTAGFRLSLPRLLGFSTPGFCVGSLAIALGVYLPHYYATRLGLPLAVVGGVFSAIRIGDTLVDPFLGVTIDKTRTAFGRYRLWLALGAPVLMAAVFMLFEPSGTVSRIYLAAWLLVYYLGTSLITLSHASWASVIASQYDERSRVFGVIQLLGVIGASAALILPIVLARRDGSSGAGGVAAMGWLVFIAVPVGVVLALLTTPEPVLPAPSQARYRVRDYVEMIFRPDMFRIIVADFCLALGPGWMAALYLFYFHDARGFTIKAASAQLLIYVVSGVAGAPALSWLATRIGKHRALMIASTCYSIGLVILSFMPKGAFLPAAVLMFALGFMASCFPLLDRAMVADVADAVRLDKGQSRVSLLYAMITTTQKLASGLSIGISFLALSAIGYLPKEGAVNTPAAIAGMELVYILGPIVFVMLGGACFIGYKLDSKRHGEIRAQLAALDTRRSEASVLQTLDGGQTSPTHVPGPA